MKKKITDKEFSVMLKDKVSSFVAKKIKDAKLVYETMDAKEKDQVILKIVSVLLDDSIPFSGEHRFKQWEKGWKENFDGYKDNMDDKFLIPKYYGKYKTVRVNGEFVKAISPEFESNMISIIV